jgi:REP element-mobilizing transposase RayT
LKFILWAESPLVYPSRLTPHAFSAPNQTNPNRLPIFNSSLSHPSPTLAACPNRSPATFCISYIPPKNAAPSSRRTRADLHSYSIGILADAGCFVIAINSVADHIHILFELNKTLALATAVQNVKQGTSRLLKTKSPALEHFQWQNGFGAFSVSASNIDDVAKYIANQEEHHRTRTFQDELRTFLQKHNVKFDEQYLWD